MRRLEYEIKEELEVFGVDYLDSREDPVDEYVQKNDRREPNSVRWVSKRPKLDFYYCYNIAVSAPYMALLDSNS